MGRITNPMAKNSIRRALREMVDRSPSSREITTVWEFFKNSCAYCGKRLKREQKEGHLDHLIADAKGGLNHISNRVLSCATCNEKEKLDKDWQFFLAELVERGIDPIIAEQRRVRIQEWIAHCPAAPEITLTQDVEEAVKRIVACFDLEASQLRKKLAAETSSHI